MTEFRDKTVFIAGGAGGLGLACARRFLDDGATVIVADRAGERAQEAAAELGGRAAAAALDVADAVAVESAMRDAAARHGRIDVLVNSAGLRNNLTVPELDAAAWTGLMRVNSDGTFFTSRSFARLLLEAGAPGAIVNIASIAGIMGQMHRTAYVASKHAVVGITRAMAMELGPMGIRVNAVAPGVIRTPMTEDHMRDPAKVERLRIAHALGRPGEPEEVAAAVRFLASDEARFITGVVLPVDGGYSAGKEW